MIDPNYITNFNSTEKDLQEVLLFWICAAGKTASTAARNLERFLNSLEGDSPFEKIKQLGIKKLPQTLKKFGIGCYNLKAKSMWELVNSDLDLRTCSVEDLECIYGIGPKTARCFIIHSRRDAECAGLDTHILKFLRSMGHSVPKSTPSTKKQYKKLEDVFLSYVKKSGQSVAEFDLNIWRYYANSRRDELVGAEI